MVRSYRCCIFPFLFTLSSRPDQHSCSIFIQQGAVKECEMLLHCSELSCLAQVDEIQIQKSIWSSLSKSQLFLQENEKKMSNVASQVEELEKGTRCLSSSVSDLSFISLTSPPSASLSLFLLSLVTLFLPVKWSDPLHGHV